MNNIEKTIKTEIDSLISIGNQIINKAINDGSGAKGGDLAEITAWVTRLGQLIRRLYGSDNQYFLNYEKALNTNAFYTIHSNWNDHISQMLGIAISIKHDYESGLINNIKALIQADIFANFLEMGEHLLKENYKDASAVIIGSVLEDSLRKLCDKHKITNNKNGKYFTIDPLNSALAKADVYSKLIQKQVTTWAHIRNKAAHGEYKEYDNKQVEMMLLFVQDFAEQHLI